MQKLSQSTSRSPSWQVSAPLRARPPSDRLVVAERDANDCIENLEVTLDALQVELDECRQRVLAAKTAHANPAVLWHLENARGDTQKWLASTRDRHHTATALRDELRSIRQCFDDYADALERQSERENRGALYQRYVSASKALEDWSATWARFSTDPSGSGSAQTTTDAQATPPDGGQQLPVVLDASPGVAARQDGLSDICQPLPWDFFQAPFPSDEQGQIEHVVGMQAQLHALDKHVQALQKRCDQLKLAYAQASPPECEAIKADYAASLKALLDGRESWTAKNSAYFKVIGENLHRLHFDAFDELLPVALVVQEIRTSTSDQAAMAAVDRYLADLKRVQTQLEQHGAQLEPHQHLFDLHATMVQIAFTGHMSYIEAIQAITLTQEAFPPQARLPLRCPWDNTPRAEIKRGAEVLLEKSRGRTTQSDVKSRSRQQMRSLGIVQQRSESIGVRLQRRAVGFDDIVADIGQIVRRRDREELTRYTLNLIGTVQQKRWLLTAADTVVDLFRRIDVAYKAIEKPPAPRRTERDEEQEPVRRVHAGHKPNRQARTAPGPKVANRRDEGPAASRPDTHDRRQLLDVGDMPDLPMTTVLGPQDLQSPDWKTAGAPATWTHYVSRPDGVETTLRATNRTLESRASNLRNWNQHDMAGNQTQALSEQDCLALIDWIAWSSREQLADDQKLFTHYTILCGPGTGDFAGQMQLKIVNNDPTVPAVVTHEFDQLQRRMKRPTFHMQVDVDADGLARIRDALALRGFPPALE